MDTGSDEEHRRFVFAAAGPGFESLIRSIDEPRVFVKLCADETTLRSLLPQQWSVQPSDCMMVREGSAPPVVLPPPYRATSRTESGVTRVEIIADDGTLAASGHAAELDGVFVYDRIVTSEGHRRRGLGRALMRELAQARRDPASREVLTATTMGRTLYEALGWRVYAPYTTAVIPDFAAR